MNPMTGYAGTLSGAAMQQHSDSTPNFLGQLPHAATFINPRMMTQPTAPMNAMPANNLPIEKLGFPDARGMVPRQSAPSFAPQPGSWQGGGLTAEMQEAQQKQMEMQNRQSMAGLGSSLGGLVGGGGTALVTGAAMGSVVPVIGTIVGGLIGAAAGFLLGD